MAEPETESGLQSPSVTSKSQQQQASPSPDARVEEPAEEELKQTWTRKLVPPAEIVVAGTTKKPTDIVNIGTREELKPTIVKKEEEKGGNKEWEDSVSEQLVEKAVEVLEVVDAKKKVHVRRLKEEKKRVEGRGIIREKKAVNYNIFKNRSAAEAKSSEEESTMKGGGVQVLEEDGEEEEMLEDDEDVEEEEETLQHMVLSKERKMMAEDEEIDDDDTAEDDFAMERDGSSEEQAAFTRQLEIFFRERKLEYKAPKFYGEELNVLKLWRAVTSLGGYEKVTSGKLWRKVGEQFEPPKTCTTISWSFRGFYEKALLDYERYHMGAPHPTSSQPDGTVSGTDSQAAMSPTTPSSQPSTTPASGSGRARRDAATRAMHGWHTQRVGNGEVGGEPIIKERSGSSKKEKQLKNLVGSKRKETTSFMEQAVKVGRAKGSRGRSLSLDKLPSGKGVLAGPGKSMAISKKTAAKPEKLVTKVNSLESMRGLKLVITDDGPAADWVKINAYRTSEGYEIYALVPGLAREEVRIQCEEGGRVVICGSPEQPNNPWGVTAFRKVINLPSKIDAHHTSAVVTLYGQLFVRVPFAHAFQ